MRILKESGNHLRNEARKNLVMVFLCIAVFSVIFISSVSVLPLYVDLGRYDTARALSMVFPMAFGLLFHRQYRHCKNGYEGERQVAERLGSDLDDQYVLLNDVDFPDGSGNTDHVVLGPTGIFTIETKNQRGWIECNGDVWSGVVGENPSKQARRNAVRISNRLQPSDAFEYGKPWVNAVVVFANKYASLDIHHKPDNVEVLKIDELARHIKERPRLLSPQEVELIGDRILGKRP